MLTLVNIVLIILGLLCIITKSADIFGKFLDKDK